MSKDYDKEYNKAFKFNKWIVIFTFFLFLVGAVEHQYNVISPDLRKTIGISIIGVISILFVFSYYKMLLSSHYDLISLILRHSRVEPKISSIDQIDPKLKTELKTAMRFQEFGMHSMFLTMVYIFCIIIYKIGFDRLSSDNYGIAVISGFIALMLFLCLWSHYTNIIRDKIKDFYI